MMSQAWMGSDFSNDDLAKSDTVLEDYTHEMMQVSSQDNHTVYTIKLIPKPRAPVVWGMQRIKIRDDHIFLVQGFYDEDMQLVKEMTTSDIVMLGGKLFPRIWRMGKAESPGEYTEVIYREAAFDIPITDGFFSNADVRNPIPPRRDSHRDRKAHKGVFAAKQKMPLLVFFVPLCESKKTHCTQKIFLLSLTEDQGIRH